MSDTKNVILVHGAFADVSGPKGVCELVKTGNFSVRITGNPTVTLEGDVGSRPMCRPKMLHPPTMWL
jgi:hypothetical protein